MSANGGALKAGLALPLKVEAVEYAFGRDLPPTNMVRGLSQR